MTRHPLKSKLLLMLGAVATAGGSRSVRRIHTTSVVKKFVSRGNFFAFLSLPKSPELDAAEVQRAYHALQRRVHPDQANVQAREVQQQKKTKGTVFPESSASSSQLQSAPVAGENHVADVDDSTYANVSYATLRDPFLRCKYLSRLCRAEEVEGRPLSLAEEEGLMSEDDQRSLEENRKLLGDSMSDMSLSPDFLAEMMAAHETIFEADTTREEHRAALTLLIAHMEERNEECYNKAKAYWERADYRGFRHCVLEWTYVRNVLIQAKDRL